MARSGPLGQASDHVRDRQALLLPAAAALDLDRALRQPLWPDDYLPGQADQVGGGELRTGPLVAVVVKDIETGRRKVPIQASAGLVGGGVPGFQVQQRNIEGCDRV